MEGDRDKRAFPAHKNPHLDISEQETQAAILKSQGDVFAGGRAVERWQNVWGAHGRSADAGVSSELSSMVSTAQPGPETMQLAGSFFL